MGGLSADNHLLGAYIDKLLVEKHIFFNSGTIFWQQWRRLHTIFMCVTEEKFKNEQIIIKNKL
jgi:hypothetical protein